MAVLVLLVGAVVCVSAIPQTDLPETSYNEVDTPVNQAPPVVTGLRFVRPAVDPVILPKNVWSATRSVVSRSFQRTLEGIVVLREPHSMQDFLCTLLI